MREVGPDAKEALEEGRVGTFVHIDLMFSPMRVHNGTGIVKWDGHRWMGMGNALDAPKAITADTIISGGTVHPPVERVVSLPMNRKLGEALIYGYYVNRKIRIDICTLTKEGDVLERIGTHTGSITKCSTTDSNALAFHVEDRRLMGHINPLQDPQQIAEDSHKASVRSRFRQNVLGLAISQGRSGLVAAIVDATSGFVGNVLSSSLSRPSRLIRQRWAARKSRYTVRADMDGTGLPPLLVSYLGGLVTVSLEKTFRAYTEKEALELFHGYVARKVWRTPRSFLKAQVSINGRRLPYMVDLDHYRKTSDPEKWANTDPVRVWGKGAAA